MPKISNQLQKITPSATLALNALSTKLRAQNHKVYNFSVGEPDYPSNPGTIISGIQSMCVDEIRYGSAGGSLQLKSAIQKKFKKENNLDFEPEEIVCGVGAKQVLFHLMQVLLNPGDEVLLHKPAWTSYTQQITSAYAKCVLIPYFCTEDHHKLTESAFSPEYIDSYSTDRTKAILLCSPNNPCGYALSIKQLKVLADYLLTKDWWIICDEIYEYFNFDNKHVSLLELCPKLKDKMIIVNGVSKSFAMTGWRMGYLAGEKNAIAGVKKLISHSSTSIPIFVEKAAMWTIDQGKDLMTDQIKNMKQKRDLAESIIKKINNLDYLKPQGAFYIYLDVRKILKLSTKYKDLDSLQLCYDLLLKHKVSTVAGEGFSTPGYLRISYATSFEDIQNGLAILSNFLCDVQK